RPEGADAFSISADQRHNVDILDKAAFDDQGTLALRPVATTVKSGTYYFATDTSITYRSDGAAWVVVGKRPNGGIATAELLDGSVTLPKLAAQPYCSLTGYLPVLTSTWTSLALTEGEDTDTMFGGVTGRITFTTAGVYLVTGQFAWDAHATGHRQISLTGTVGGIPMASIHKSLTGNGTYQSLSRLMRVTAGNYIGVSVWQDSGATLNCQAAVDALLVRA
ncbi:MAG: hypothetical protein JHC87_08880, partial [Thermoleophilaceae bacterium]|nr:hypothetical protein [Thermoleophilaceae bacterium]